MENSNTNKKSQSIMILIGAILCILTLLSFTFLGKKESKPQAAIIPDIYSDKMCAASKLYEEDIEMEDIYTCVEPLAPKLKTKWQSNLKITTTSDVAKTFFSQGLLNLYAFNHAEANRSFKEAIRQDPECAMCHWGVALGLGPNINLPMEKEDNRDAVKYSKKALALSQHCMPHEKALIEAINTRYSADTLMTREALNTNYANEMRLVSQRFRDDLDIATLFVESMMDCMPWAYWESDGKPKPATREVLAVLDYIAEKDPDHPGANHYHIHVVEEVQPHLGSSSADRLANLKLNEGHLIHMPSHIYIQMGRYNEASIANQKAIVADDEYLALCKAQDIYPAVYVPHNVHFLSFSSSMEGRSKLAIEQARALVDKTPTKMLTKYRSLEQYLPMPYLALVRFQKWNEILKEAKPDKNLLYTNMIWHYARGMAYANKGQLQNAKNELEKIEIISNYETYKKLHSGGWPTISIANMASLVLKAEIAGANNKMDKKINYLREAVTIQDDIIFVETPHFYYPIRQSLGQALLTHNKSEEAIKTFKEDLSKWKDNGWSLHGMYQGLLQQKQYQQADQVKTKYDQAWKNADITL